MKTKIFLFLGLPCLLLFSSFHYLATKQIVFEDAIKEKLILYSLSSNGGHDLSSVHLNVTNASTSVLSITIPNGTVFIPKDPGDQDLLLVEDALLVLQPKQKKEIVLNAYCMESSDRSPQKGASMTFRALDQKDPLRKLCAQINSKKNSAMDIQSAVWAVSDNQPIEYLSLDNPSSNALRNTVCTITGRENTWYSRDANRQINPDRTVVTRSTSISGRMSIDIKSKATVETRVVDNNGVTKLTMGPREFSKAGVWGYSFNLKVTGWANGQYRAVVLQDGIEIKSYPFSV